LTTPGRERISFQDYVDRLAVAGDLDALISALADASAEYGLGRVAYLGLQPLPTACRPILLSTYPAEWVERYLARSYQRVDPVIRLAADSSLPFEWSVEDAPRRMSPEQLQLFDEAAGFGIARGFSVPVHHSSGQVAAITFASEEPEGAFRRIVERNRHVLHLAGIYFHAHVSRLLIQTTRKVLDQLTPREVQCLTWAARGKSATDIGTILSISRHTAVFHLENAKRKLGVRTAYQAIAILVAARPRQGLDDH
jgi:DNA-binding CsgD family transcriptional regulator